MVCTETEEVWPIAKIGTIDYVIDLTNLAKFSFGNFSYPRWPLEVIGQCQTIQHFEVEYLENGTR